MVFNTGAALLDAIVLSVVSMEPEGTYGYRITQEVRSVLNVSESTLYPVLRRLQKDDCLSVYDREYGGRNRRYYKITEQGWAQLGMYREEWSRYSEKISGILLYGRTAGGMRQKRKEASGGGEKNGRSSRAGWSACYE